MSRFARNRKNAPLGRRAAAVRDWLGPRTLVLVGLMGCGKTSVGRRLATALDLPFVDADAAIEEAAGKTISEIFAEHGEAHFRDGERRVIARLLAGGPQILATGGGAFMNEETRANIAASGQSVWLKADLPLLMKRVMRRSNRPLLKTDDPEARMRDLMSQRYPVYELADFTVVSRDVPHDVMVGEILSIIADRYLGSVTDDLEDGTAGEIAEGATGKGDVSL
jgi:shikimate kinase